VRDETEQSLIDSEALIAVARQGPAWATRSRRASRPSCTGSAACAAPANWPRATRTWIQSHVAENKDEIRWARELFPASRSYLAVYQDFGLMRERAIYAHCIHFDDEDRMLMRDTGAAGRRSAPPATCSRQRLLRLRGRAPHRLPHGLASDVGGGTSFCPFHTMLAAYYVGREGQTKPGLSLSPQTCGGSTPRARRRRWASRAWSATCGPAARPTSWCWTRRPRRCWRARRRRRATSTSCCSR
jgi:guanine deaminase